MHYMGLGNPPAHLPVILPEQIEPILKPTLKSTFALAQIAAPAYTLPKLSLGFLYLRIFTSRWFRIAAYTIMFLSVSLWIVRLFPCMYFGFRTPLILSFRSLVGLRTWQRIHLLANSLLLGPQHTRRQLSQRQHALPSHPAA